MHKRGQVTLFIILGIVIIVAVVIFFYVKSNNLNVPFFSTNIFSGLDHNIETCVEEVAVDGLYLTGMQGGYYKIIGKQEHYLNYNIPYYDKPITKEDFSSELQDYINDNLYNCVTLDSFSSQNFSIKTGKVYSKVDINPKKLVIKVDPKVTASKDSSVTSFGPYTKDVNFDYFEILNITKTIVGSESSIPMGLLTSLADDKNFKFDITMLNNNTVLYVLFFNNTIKSDNLYKFAFVRKYDWK